MHFTKFASVFALSQGGEAKFVMDWSLLRLEIGMCNGPVVREDVVAPDVEHHGVLLMLGPLVPERRRIYVTAGLPLEHYETRAKCSVEQFQ